MNYYNDTCPDCGMPARFEEMSYPADEHSPETILLCSNPACEHFDAENLGPKSLIDFVQTAQDIDRLLIQASEKLTILKRQAEQIARMNTEKVGTLIQKQEKEGRVSK